MADVKVFVDTNILLHSDNLDKLIEEYDKIYLSSVVILELESIKTSANKDNEIKYKSRKALRHMIANEDKYEIIIIDESHREICKDKNLDLTNDNLIIAAAYKENQINEVLFISNDVLAYKIAKDIFKLNTIRLLDTNDDNYTGYKLVEMSDEELASWYESDKKENKYNLLINEYLLIKDSTGKIIDKFRWTGEEHILLNFKPVKSDMLGKLKILDEYQSLVIDSLHNNLVTIVKGRAGSGKSYLAMNYLLSELEKGKIDKIIIFVNSPKVRDSVALGFYPGDKNSKLLDSTIGNFLIGKIGDRSAVEMMINQDRLLLLPMSDIRGFDCSEMNAGIYITEAQNTSIDLMKLVLQRCGDSNNFIILDGDYNTQVDDSCFSGSNNGMRRVSEVFRGQNFYGEVQLDKIYRGRIAEIADLM